MVATVGLFEISCLRLALGMIASLLVLNHTPIPPRFFRVQFLAAMGMMAVPTFFQLFFPIQCVRDGSWSVSMSVNRIWDEWMLIFLLTSAGFCFLGCILWHLDDAPGGNVCIRMASLGLVLTVFFAVPVMGTDRFDWCLDWWRLGDNYASAGLLGTTTSAMLLGHSYLISPAMTIVPLRRMLAAGTVALALRVTLACWGLYWWTGEHPVGNLERETLLWLIARWLLGILAPLALGWMAWETARIRSTQSATGILYVVVIVTFLGELTSLLLLEKTGFPL